MTRKNFNERSEHRVSIIVNGATGRVGSRVCALALSDDRFEVRAALTRDATRHAGREWAPGKTLETAEKTRVSADVVIDFSSDNGAAAALDLASRIGAALMVGTTALTDETTAKLREESSRRAILIAANTSLGVAAMTDAARRLARSLGPSYRASIVESHHSMKKDAPSGTALRLASALRESGADLPMDQVLAIRSGDVIGEHTIRFAGKGEYIELTHRATTRDLFAYGALNAALFLAGREPGWYTIEDVLGLCEERR